MRKLLSVVLILTIALQLCPISISTVSAATSVDCIVNVSAGNGGDKVKVDSSVVKVVASYDNNNFYTTKDVTFTASSELNSGLVFDHWKDAYGNIISQDSVYEQAIAASVDYKAYYSSYTPGTTNMLSTSDYDYSTAYNLSATSPTKVSAGGSVSVSANVSVPRKYRVVEAGAIFYEGVYTENFNIFNADAKKVTVSSINKTTSGGIFGIGAKTTGSYSVSYTPSDQYGVLSRAYVIYLDGSSRIYVGYTEPEYTRPDTDFYNNVKEYDVVFNWEMLATFTGVGKDTPHTKELHQKSINDVCESNADLITVTPQMYRMNLYPTNVPGEGFAEKEKYLQNNPDYEINYYLMGTNPSIGSTWYDKARDYIYVQGKDPTLEVIEAVKANGADCFINYRMNDHHNTCTEREKPDDNRTGYPTHSAFWLENEDEYGIGFSSNRVLNYMAPHIRDHYYQILEELATKYVDYIDGIELDFDRYFEYFSFAEASQGSAILTDFVARVREMLNRVGMENGKYLQLSVRVPGQTAKGDQYGIDPLTWDAKGYVDIIDLSNHYFNTLDIDIEAYTENNKSNDRAHARINGEIHYNTYQESKSNVASNGAISSSTYRRYMTKEGYFATAANFLARGCDGVHLFNVLYSAKKEQVYKDLAVLRDKEALAKADKCYIMERGGRGSKYAGVGSLNKYVGFQRNTTTRTYNIYMPDDMSNFTDAVLKLEYYTNIVDETGALIKPEVTVSWGSDTVASTAIQQVNIGSTELFPALDNNQSYTTWDESMFFKIPIDLMQSSDGVYKFTVTVVDGETLNTSPNQLYIESAEIGLYNRSDEDNNELSELKPGFTGGVNNMTVIDTDATVAPASTLDSYDGDGYVLSVTNRTNEIAGAKFENVSFIPGNLYVVSAFAKLAGDGESKALMNVSREGEVSNGSEFTISGDKWTRVYFLYDITSETGQSFNGDIYVTTPGSTNDILLDNFELFVIEPYTPVAGNIYNNYNPSFETGSTGSWLTFKGNTSAIQADPFPHSGKWSGYAYDRYDSIAAGLQLQYIDVLPDTYYYVSGYGRTDSASLVSATITMQYQLRKGSETVSNKGGVKIQSQSVSLNNTSWQRVDGIFKTITPEELEAEYPGYRIQGKVYIGANQSYNLYYDDFAVVPICINEDFKVITPVEGNATVELTVPLEFEVSKNSLKTSIGTIEDISRNGTKCVVSLKDLNEPGDGVLYLTTANTVLNAPAAELKFKVNEPNILANYKPGFADGENNMVASDASASIATVANDTATDGDGYVLSVKNRTSEIVGGKFENVNLTPGKLYAVTAFAKLQSQGEAKAKINTETSEKTESSSEVTLSADGWTRVVMYYDLTESEESLPINIYVSTPGSKADVLIDNFRVFEQAPYVPVEGNIYGGRNPSFESGTTTYWTINKAKGQAIQADPFPHSGKWCGYSYERSLQSSSFANGFQTGYVIVEPDTYYFVSGWARTGSETATSGSIPMQFQLSKSGSSNVSNKGGKGISSVSANLDNKAWYKMYGLYKTITQEEVDATYPGYSIAAKIYPSVNTSHDVYVDDFAAVPLCINKESRIVGATDGRAVLKLTVPVEFEVTTDTLTTNVGMIETIEREGINCTVTLRGLNTGIDGALTLKTDSVISGAAPAVMNYKVSGYSVTAAKIVDSSTVNCQFKNYTNDSVNVRLAIVAYENNRVVSIEYANTISVKANETSETIVLPLYTNGDRVEILALNPDTVAPYILPFDCSVLN